MSGSSAGPSNAGTKRWTGVRGDWSDISAAMDAVAERHALGILERVGDASAARFELVDIRGRPVAVVVSREAIADSGSFTVEIHAGRFGDADLERKIARDLAHRLDQLFGVDVAPIDWSR